MFTVSVALSCHQCDTCISPVCLCSPTQREGLLPTVELSSFNIPTFLIPWRDGFGCWRGSQTMTHFTDRQEQIDITCQEKVFFQAFTWMVSRWVQTLIVQYEIASLHFALITLLFAFNRGPPLVFPPHLSSPFLASCQLLTTPTVFFGEGVKMFFFFFRRRRLRRCEWGCRCC